MGNPFLLSQDELSAELDAAERAYAQLESERDSLLAKLAEAEKNAEDERERYRNLVSKIIDESGVDVPIGGMTALMAVAELRKHLAEAQTQIERHDAIVAKLKQDHRDQQLESMDKVEARVEGLEYELELRDKRIEELEAERDRRIEPERVLEAARLLGPNDDAWRRAFGNKLGIVEEL